MIAVAIIIIVIIMTINSAACGVSRTGRLGRDGWRERLSVPKGDGGSPQPPETRAVERDRQSSDTEERQPDVSEGRREEDGILMKGGEVGRRPQGTVSVHRARD